MIEGIEEACLAAPGNLDPDTYVSPESFSVASLAAGAAVELALSVARGDAKIALAAVRPPGHHAEAARAMGFCLFNNVAIATRALQAELDVAKVLLIDFDVHHGNGTQHSFADDPSVLYVSTHQYPYYPGSGDFGEIGSGAGEGFTLNIPLPAGCGDTEYVGALQRLLVPAARVFAPEMIVVSAGFDAHRDDPLAAMQVTRAGYHAMVSIVRALAEELCRGRLLFVLEGGYAASGLREGVSAMLDALLASQTVLPAAIEMPTGSTLARVVDRVVDVHGSRIPDLGAA
jgi:acetoin utilization deacetylase AcuC-like enzyme